jgi:phenylpropionate dioxygenase-like ring-hydroxylating dioxygenase large terminal subunit
VLCGDGTFRNHTRAYTDPEIFDLELARIWDKTWVSSAT